MNYSFVSFFVMLVVFVSYVLFIWIKYGVQESISDSYYRLPNNYNFIFTLFCWGFAIPAILAGNTLLMFLAGSGIAFVGAAARFKEIMTKQVHMIGAFCGVIFSQLSIFFDFKMWYINVVFIVGALIIILLKKQIKNYTWWIEILAFSLICYALGSKLL